MIRCFLDFGYIGTQFRGVQRLWSCKLFEDSSTIEGNLEIAFQNSPFQLKSYIDISSRTDAGVHALHNTAHVDICEKNGLVVNVEYMRAYLNRYFSKRNLPIIINRAQRVNSDFHCRRLAKSRTYLYRQAIVREEYDYDFKYFCKNIEEWRRSSFFLNPEWDIEKFREGAKLLVGKHDFETFRKGNRTKVYQENIKTVNSIDILPSSQLKTRFTNAVDNIEHYDVVVEGKSFIHNQIRRMVAALNCVACGTLSLRDLQIMIQVPSRHSWPTFIEVAPAHGLYLSSINYNPQDLLFTEEDNDQNIEKAVVEAS